MVSKVLEQTIGEYCKKHVKCVVCTRFGKYDKRIYSGYIKDFDSEFIKFIDKYNQEITIRLDEILKIERGGGENGS